MMDQRMEHSGRPPMFYQQNNMDGPPMGFQERSHHFPPHGPPEPRFERPEFDPENMHERPFPPINGNGGNGRIPLRNPNNPGPQPAMMRGKRRKLNYLEMGGASKAKRFLMRLKTEIHPPRHPSATVGKPRHDNNSRIAIPQHREAKIRQTLDMLKIFSHVEILEKRARDDILSEDEHVEEPKPAEAIDNMKLLLEDDEMLNEPEERNQAQAEDDIPEESSHDESEANEKGKFSNVAKRKI